MQMLTFILLWGKIYNYTQKRADIVDIPSVYHLVISPGQGDISSAQGDITFTL